MSVQKIAGRYAKSLIDLAIEQNKMDIIKEDVATFKSATENRDFYLLMKSPIVNAAKKQSIIKALFEDKIDETTLAFLNIIIAKGREEYLPEIAGAFVDQYNQIQKLSKVKVTTAAPMDHDALEAIKKKIVESGFTSSNIEIESVVDPNIIGGFILEFGDRLYNDSVAHKLEVLKKDFSTKQFEKQI